MVDGELAKRFDARRGFLAPAVLLVALTAMVFLPVVSNGFIWDDDRNITANPNMQGLSGLWRIWTAPRTSQQYYPLTHTSFWIDWRLWGRRPAPFHIENVLLHALGAVLLWRVLRRLEVPAAWLASAVFAIHPVQVESVAWITERKNTLSGVFYFAALLFLLRVAGVGPGFASERGARVGRFAGCTLFLLALLSKTAVLTLPAALAIGLWWKRGRLDRSDVRLLVPLCALGAAMGGLTAALEWGHVGAGGPEWGLSFAGRVVVAARAFCFYAGKLAAPIGLNFIYPRWSVDPGRLASWSWPAGALALLGILWSARARIGRAPLAAALFFGVTLAPVLGFFDFYFQLYSLVQDHFQYLACAGPIALVVGAAGAVRRAGRPALRAAAVVLAGAVLAGLGGASFVRAHVFRNDETLWTSVLARNPRAWMAQQNLGVVYLGQRKPEAALEQFGRALRQTHPYPHEVHMDIGLAYEQLGRSEQAIASHRKALHLAPDFVPARIHLARGLAAAGRYEEARGEWEQALKRPGAFEIEILLGLAETFDRLHRPDDARALIQRAASAGTAGATGDAQRGDVLVRAGRYAEAVVAFGAAVSATPEDADLHRNLGQALVEVGRFDEAEQRFAEALRLRPGDPKTLQAQAGLFARRGRHEEAIAEYRRAIAADPADALAQYNLGLSLEAVRRPGEAVAAYREAIRLDPRFAEPHNNLAILLYFDGQHDAARDEVRIFERLGGRPHPEFVKALAGQR